ncbi:hypothetical protein [Sagittula salina]|nr:hypothetical protein [Sagittula salina]
MKRLLDWLRAPASTDAPDPKPGMTSEEKARLALAAFPKCC